MIQIYHNLDSKLHFDVTKTFSSQKKMVNKKILPAIKAAMNPSIEFYDKEVVNIIKQLHKSRREIWKLSQQEGRLEEHMKKQHTVSRRSQV